ncbi:MAG: dicarboxylate/amino acid:cation symporter [Bacteroidetes bacterium]|nr:dicarboxylate/amino acid:cation symporter [Bacteroidota bacterium]
MKFKAPSLVLQIFVGMVLGITVGYFCWRSVYAGIDMSSIAEEQVTALQNQAQHIGDRFQLLSDIFLRLIKMIITPLVFSLLLVGIAKAGDFKVVGRLGLKTILYFTFAALIALSIGLVIVNIFEPGAAMDLQKASSTVIVQPKPFNAKDFISNIFPESVVEEMTKNHILPIIVFVLFFAIATASIGEKGKIVIEFFDAVGHVMLKVTNYVMKFAPFAVFGAMGAIITTKGLAILTGYLSLIACFFGGLLFFVFVVLTGICLVMRINFFKLLSYIKEPALIAFSTSSSEAAMPKTIEALERFGCGNRIISFVLPLGYSFNLDGSIMYSTFATMAIAQAYGMSLTLGNQISMMLMLMVTSKGMAGVPRASLVVIAGMLDTFHIPVEGLTLLLAIDWLLDMGRSATNVVGNAVATAVVSKWEGELHEFKKERDIDHIKLG